MVIFYMFYSILSILYSITQNEPNIKVVFNILLSNNTPRNKPFLFGPEQSEQT